MVQIAASFAPHWAMFGQWMVLLCCTFHNQGYWQLEVNVVVKTTLRKWLTRFARLASTDPQHEHVDLVGMQDVTYPHTVHPGASSKCFRFLCMFLLAIFAWGQQNQPLGMCVYTHSGACCLLGGLFKLNWMPARAGCFDKAATVDAVKCCNSCSWAIMCALTVN